MTTIVAGDSVPPCISLDAFLVDDRHSLLEALRQISLLAKSGGLSRKYAASPYDKTAKFPLQVTPDSVTVLVKSHADIGHSEPVTNLGGRQDGTGLLGLFFAIFAMTSFRSRQDWKAGGSLLFMVASFSLCTVRTKSPRELYKSGGKRVQRIWSEYSEGKNKVNCGGINWLGMESHVDFGHVEGLSHL